jgi:hypothetical protein
MGVSDLRQAWAALYLQGKDHRYPLYRRLGGSQSRSGHRDYRKTPYQDVLFKKIITVYSEKHNKLIIRSVDKKEELLTAEL